MKTSQIQNVCFLFFESFILCAPSVAHWTLVWPIEQEAAKTRQTQGEGTSHSPFNPPLHGRNRFEMEKKADHAEGHLASVSSKKNKSVHFLFVCFVEMKDTLSLSAAFGDDALTTTA